MSEGTMSEINLVCGKTGFNRNGDWLGKMENKKDNNELQAIQFL
jgi:hypothetical protein